MGKLDEVEAKFAKADDTIEQAKAFLSKFQSFLEEYGEKEQVISELAAFYHSGDWAEEADLLHRELPSRHFISAGEDTIWNIEEEFRGLNIKMVKLISDCLYKEIAP